MKIAPFSKREFRTLAGASLLAFIILGVGLRFRALKEIPVIVVPARTMPSPNAYETLRSAYAAFVPPTVPVDDFESPQSPTNTYLQKDRVAWIAANAPALRLLRRALTEDYGVPLPVPVSHSVECRRLMRLLAIESHARRLNGDWKGAVRSALDIVRLGDKISRRRGYLGLLMGGGMKRMGIKELKVTFPHLNGTDLRQAIKELEGLYVTRLSLREALVEQKLQSKLELVRMIREGTLQQNVDLINEFSEAKSPLLQRRFEQVFRNYKQIFDGFDHYFDTLIAAAKEPYRTGNTVPTPECTANNSVLCTIAVVYGGGGKATAVYNTPFTFLLVQMGLQVYHQENGSYPARLQELAPRYLKAIPLDPYGAGQILGYKRTSTGYTLYSVGPDGKDDGGRPKPSRQWKGKTTWPIDGNEKGDLVAGLHFE